MLIASVLCYFVLMSIMVNLLAPKFQNYGSHKSRTERFRLSRWSKVREIRNPVNLTVNQNPLRKNFFCHLLFFAISSYSILQQRDIFGNIQFKAFICESLKFAQSLKLGLPNAVPTKKKRSFLLKAFKLLTTCVFGITKGYHFFQWVPIRSPKTHVIQVDYSFLPIRQWSYFPL